MNNEPVAWMEIEEGGITEYKVWREPVSSKSIPLYTHPVKEQLTDDETESFEFWSPTTGWDSIPIPANKKLSGRDLQRWRQEAWRRLDDDYKQDPEGAFVMGFDAGIAILRKAQEK